MYFREYALTNESKSPNQYIFSNILNFTQKRILKTNYSEKNSLHTTSAKDVQKASK